MSFWTGVYLPPGAPPALVKRLNDMLSKAVATEGFKAFNAKTSGEIAFSSPEELARFQAAESKKWGQVIRAAQIQPE